jgi:aquaporin Z
MTWTATQRYLAEFVGTFGLLLSVTGAALLSLNLGPAGFSGDSRVLLISMALGLGVLGMAYAFGDISGGHFNPAITVGMWIAGRTKTRDVVPYIVAQVIGGIVAVAVIAGVAYGSSSLWASAQGAALASQGYSGNGSPYTVGLGSVFLLEVVLTMFLTLVALRATATESFAKNLAPVGIALTLLMTNLVAIPIDGASINPARSFAPAILSAMWSGDQWAIQQDWLFWVAPIIGGIVAALIDRVYRSGGAPA